MSAASTPSRPTAADYENAPTLADGSPLPRGPRYWTLEGAIVSAQWRASLNDRPYFIFDNLDGTWNVSRHPEPAEGCVMVRKVQP